MKTTWVVVTILLAVMVYYLYTPVPDGIDEKLKFRAFVGVQRIFKVVVSVAFQIRIFLACEVPFPRSRIPLWVETTFIGQIYSLNSYVVSLCFTCR